MSLISPEYKELNAKLHKDNPHYGKSGMLYAKEVMGLCIRFDSQDVLDYGCGKSTLANNLPFKIKQYDPCVEVRSTYPLPADILVCTDVLEHIEPECISDVLESIGSLTKKVAYLVVANGKAQKTLEDGRNAHLIQEPVDWWMKAISANLDVISHVKLASLELKDGSLFEEYGFTAIPYQSKETKDEQV